MSGRKAGSSRARKGKRKTSRRKRSRSLETCSAILATLLPALTAVNKAARAGDLPQFRIALRDLRDAVIAAELLMAREVRI